MKRKRLTLNDIAGDLLDSYEKKYQEILEDYKVKKAECSKYRDDIKQTKGLELQKNYLEKAKNLRNEMHAKVMEIIDKKKAEFTAAQEEKNKPLDLEKEFPSAYGLKDLDSGNQYIKRNEAFKYLYKAIEKNSNLLMTNLLLKSGDNKAIGAFLEKNKDNNDLINIVESNLKATKDPKYSDLLQDISDSKVTAVDDMNIIASNLKFDENGDKMHTGVTLDRVHNLNEDFNAADIIYKNGDPSSQFFKTGE